MSTDAPLGLHPDRLLPVDPGTRDIARRIHARIADLPIISPHGHVPAHWLADDLPFTDPTSLLISPDHYLTRLLHASGIPLAALGVDGHPLSEEQSRRAWRMFCTHWPVYRGTPVRFWMESVLHDIFAVATRPSATTSDAIYDTISDALTTDGFRPRALLGRFGITVLATTDDPCADLADHAALRDDPDFAPRVLPTFRPDKYLEPGRPDWPDLVDAIGTAADIDTGDYTGFVAALEQRRRHFIEHGAVSADHSHTDLITVTLDHDEADRIFRAARAGVATEVETTMLRRHLVTEMARMSVDDGLVMTVHPGVARNHHGPTARQFGSDTGHDIPITAEFTRGLQHLLDRFGTAEGFHLVVFTLDESTLAREIAPLAGFYPAVYIGAPWWFLDAPEAAHRFRSAVTETAGFYRTSGFIDDTRAFCSIPARHDMARRVDSGYLAELVAAHRLDLDEAIETATELVLTQPRKVFKL